MIAVVRVWSVNEVYDTTACAHCLAAYGQVRDIYLDLVPFEYDVSA